jgi:hypothetical protein
MQSRKKMPSTTPRPLNTRAVPLPERQGSCFATERFLRRQAPEHAGVRCQRCAAAERVRSQKMVRRTSLRWSSVPSKRAHDRHCRPTQRRILKPEDILASAGPVNPPKLLLDENPPTWIALTLTREGYDVVHVRDRGLLQATDAQVFSLLCGATPLPRRLGRARPLVHPSPAVSWGSQQATARPSPGLP